jgi:glutathione-regulated potassium-efflux system ancillary protein KefG
VKQWEDLVLQYGFAYGKEGTKLKGKWVLTAITTGGSRLAYGREGLNYFTIRELLNPFEQTARFCGMVYLPPFVVSGTFLLTSETEIAIYAAMYRDAIERLRDGQFNAADFQRTTYLNQLLQTPQDAFGSPGGA